jgi:hypothetical protein
MAGIQSTFVYDRAVGYPGCVVDAVDTVRESRAAGAAVNFGTLVCKRAADDADECGNPAASADVTARVLGVALRDETRKHTTGYETGDQVTYLRKGRVYVTVESDVVAGAAAYVRFTVEAPDLQLGAFRADVDTDKAVALPGAVFRTTTSAGGLAILELNLPA